MSGTEATGMARYSPGGWVAIASPSAWLLGEFDPHSPSVATYYDLIVRGAAAEDILDAILAVGFRAVPSFAFVSAPRATLLLRGSARASVVSAAGETREYDAGGTTTWAEHRLLEQPAAFRLIGTAPPPGSVELPLSNGVSMAAAVTVHTQPGTQALPSPSVTAVQSAPPAAPAAVPPAAPAAVPPAAPAAARVDTGGNPIIDSLPWQQQQPPQPASAPEPDGRAAPPGPSVEQANGEPEATMGQSLLRALIAAQDPEPASGPTVHAVHCRNGHLNPAHAAICRACGAPVLDEAPVTVPRPVLGILRLSTGDVIPLDRGVLLGRNPAGSTGPDSDRHVVRVPSPTGDISRAHTEVRLDGWHVLAVDLNSTNGTVVVLPGRAPERLRPNEPRPIEPGTVVMLSEEVSFRFEVDQ